MYRQYTELRIKSRQSTAKDNRKQTTNSTSSRPSSKTSRPPSANCTAPAENNARPPSASNKNSRPPSANSKPTSATVRNAAQPSGNSRPTSANSKPSSATVRNAEQPSGNSRPTSVNSRPSSATVRNSRPTSANSRPPSATVINSDKPSGNSRPTSAHSRPSSATGIVVEKPFRSNRPSSASNYTEGSHKPEFDPKLWDLDGIDTEENNTAIKNVELDFMKADNGIPHRTFSYSGDELVLRRGHEFKLKFKFDSYDQGKDRLEIQFRKGEKPQASKGTLFVVKVCSDKATAEKETDKDGWFGYLEAVQGGELTVAIQTDSCAPVGAYTIRIRVFDATDKNKTNVFIKQFEQQFYLLFNAWCEDDQVFLSSEIDRDEYVLNETGDIWRGSASSFKPKPWNFGQFSRYCLRAAVYLLDQSDLSDQEHGNVTQVCRTLSSMANSCDGNNGVLTGNWSGDYAGGVRPTEWNGSQAILEQYMKTKTDVRFGQCWVFSGLTTTLCRTLGIPCRSVTNFASAHDTDMSLTIDKHFMTEGPDEGKPLDHMDDSVWNFHVWNEAWFKRPDLPDGYDGWQAFDATPQEASDGIMQCGPAPVKAIKEGLLYLDYDAKFIFAEVNGDRITWSVKRNGEMVPGNMSKHSVGKFISTRSIDGEREDVTGHYKFPEGSEEERASVTKAAQFSGTPEKMALVYENNTGDVEFSNTSECLPNGDVKVTFTAENNGSEQINLKVKMTSTAAYYTGRTGKELSCDKVELVLGPKEKQDKSWTITAASYLNEIDEDAKLQIHLWSKVVETGQWFVDSDILLILKPDLVLKVSNEEPAVGEEFTVTITMDNPVDVDLTDGVIQLEGPGIQKNMNIKLKGSVAANGTLEEKVQLKAKYNGDRSIIACFNSRQLTDITGFTKIKVV